MEEQRLIDIETKVLYQENTIEQLNQVVCRQQDQIEQLEKKIERLTKNFKSILDMSEDVRPGHEKPPHY